MDQDPGPTPDPTSFFSDFQEALYVKKVPYELEKKDFGFK